MPEKNPIVPLVYPPRSARGECPAASGQRVSGGRTRRGITAPRAPSGGTMRPFSSSDTPAALPTVRMNGRFETYSRISPAGMLSSVLRPSSVRTRIHVASVVRATRRYGELTPASPSRFGAATVCTVGAGAGFSDGGTTCNDPTGATATLGVTMTGAGVGFGDGGAGGGGGGPATAGGAGGAAGVTDGVAGVATAGTADASGLASGFDSARGSGLPS